MVTHDYAPKTAKGNLEPFEFDPGQPKTRDEQREAAVRRSFLLT
jgi:hypothetical protein